MGWRVTAHQSGNPVGQEDRSLMDGFRRLQGLSVTWRAPQSVSFPARSSASSSPFAAHSGQGRSFTNKKKLEELITTKPVTGNAEGYFL